MTASVNVGPWDAADSAAATAEGWDVFNYGSDDARVERLDDVREWDFPGEPPRQLSGDDEAWDLIRQGMAMGSPLHVRAFNAVPPGEQALILAGNT